MKQENIKVWRVVDVLLWTKEYLRQKGIESPQIEAEWLLREVLKCSRLDLYLRHDQPLTPVELDAFKKLLSRRVAGEPIQYVLGKSEFMGLELEVNPSVLIPRPETEILVEVVLNKIKQGSKPKINILDVGTGSGCIAIALAHYNANCYLYALDVSEEALAVAQRNIKKHHLEQKIQLLRLDILKQVPKLAEPLDVIVSNPPYVAGEWVAKLPKTVKDYEPAIALFPGDDELKFYRRLCEIAPQLLTKGGLLAVEIGGSYQEKAVQDLFKQAKFAKIESFPDYTRQIRVVVGQWED